MEDQPLSLNDLGNQELNNKKLMIKVSDSKKKLIIIGVSFLFIILIILFIIMIEKMDNSKQIKSILIRAK